VERGNGIPKGRENLLKSSCTNCRLIKVDFLSVKLKTPWTWCDRRAGGQRIPISWLLASDSANKGLCDRAKLFFFVSGQSFPTKIPYGTVTLFQSVHEWAIIFNPCTNGQLYSRHRRIWFSSWKRFSCTLAHLVCHNRLLSATPLGSIWAAAQPIRYSTAFVLATSFGIRPKSRGSAVDTTNYITTSLFLPPSSAQYTLSDQERLPPSVFPAIKPL
jgi:hypothetical protein